MSENHGNELVKEVYARFGLAIYFAQVLEHGLVNALVVLDLIPARRHLVRSADEWGENVDSFMDRHFETTMGRMMRSLRDVAEVPSDLETLLRDALKKRNWLAHDFFRERAVEFMSRAGQDQMIQEIDDCLSRFQEADRQLEEVVKPLREKAGLTDEVLEREYRSMLGEIRPDRGD